MVSVLSVNIRSYARICQRQKSFIALPGIQHKLLLICSIWVSVVQMSDLMFLVLYINGEIEIIIFGL